MDDTNTQEGAQADASQQAADEAAVGAGYPEPANASGDQNDNPDPPAVDEPASENPAPAASDPEPAPEPEPPHPFLLSEAGAAIKAWVRAEILHMQMGRSEESRKILNP